MILPIVCYCSVVWYANNSDLQLIESIQKKVTRWILNYNQQSYVERLRTLNLLPLTYYLQMMDLLCLSKIICGQYDFDWTSNVSFACTVGTRSAAVVNFDLPRVRLEKSKCNFWYRVQKLANWLPPCVDFFTEFALKPRLLRFCWWYFNNVFDVSRVCTWRLGCGCGTCRLAVTPAEL